MSSGPALPTSVGIKSAFSNILDKETSFPPLFIVSSRFTYNIVANILIEYSRCSKISNTFLFLFSNEMLVFRAGIHKMLVRIANREDPFQRKQSDIGLHRLSRPFWQATCVQILEHIP